MHLSPIAIAFVALAAAAPLHLEAQDDRLTVHGALNVGYGRTDGVPYFGLNKEGTSENRALALQFGYRLGDRDRMVTQLLHRRFGTSPQNAVEPDIQPIWAFYEHRFENGAAVKVGRNPLPRGSFNEVRFIGTLLPFYRVGGSVYGETLEYLDGIVASKPVVLGNGFNLDASVFSGGFDIKAQVPDADGNKVVSQRNEGLVGAQVWLKTPVPGVRFGTFASSWRRSEPGVSKANRSTRTSSLLFSGEAIFTHAFLRGEFTTFRTEKPYVNYDGWYVLGGINPTEQFTVAAEYSSGSNTSRLPTPLPSITLPVTHDVGVSLSWKPQPAVAFKLEGRRNVGYGFDVPVKTVSPIAVPPFIRIEPATRAYYGMLSVAVAF